MSDETEILKVEKEIGYALYDEISECYYSEGDEDTKWIGKIFDNYDYAWKTRLGMSHDDCARFEVVRVVSTIQAEVMK